MSDIREALTEWVNATSTSSSPGQIMSDPHAQVFLTLGNAAVPELVNSLRDQPTMHAVLALNSITGLQPYANKDRGNLAAMARGWIAWADGK